MQISFQFPDDRLAGRILRIVGRMGIDGPVARAV
jgi:hypothetical protein